MKLGHTYHCHSEKPGLIISLVREWPVSWLTGKDGKPFGSLQQAIQAVIDLPMRYVPMGCPSPDDDGRCPGHVREEAARG